jgi:hypothetical protein
MTALNTVKNAARASSRGVLALAAAALVALPAADAANPPANTAMAPMPLASYPQGQAMLKQALDALALSATFKFLDKTYENDQYASVAGQKVRTACLRSRATSGFAFNMPRPTAQLTHEGLRVVGTINHIDANGLTVKVQAGPCMDIASGMGIKLSDVKVIYEARPTLRFSEGVCHLHWNEDPDSLRVQIGDMNIIGLQNNLDKLAKDAVREAANATFKLIHHSLRNNLNSVSIDTCGSRKKTPLIR